MKRFVLALAVAASFAIPAAPSFADHCGDTLQPPCETCVLLVCVPVDTGHVVP